MSAAQLRQAAETLRLLASKAVPGPWFLDDAGEGIRSAEGDWVADAFERESAYLSTVHPGVGLAVAQFLEHSALLVESRDLRGVDTHCYEIARLINGGAP